MFVFETALVTVSIYGKSCIYVELPGGISIDPYVGPPVSLGIPRGTS